MRLRPKKYALILLSFAFFSCKTPPVPPEVNKAEEQEHNLWRAGAPVYAVEDYDVYKQELRAAKDKFLKEKAKFRWFRNYDKVKADFLNILAKGDGILAKVLDLKASTSQSLSQQLSILQKRIFTLKGITLSMNEHQQVRKSLTQAEVALREAQLLFEKEKFRDAADVLKVGNNHVDQAEEAVFIILERYTDKKQVERWKKWADDTIAESKKKGIVVILVDKLERTLTLYKKGELLATYEIGLGKYGLSDKLYAGDNATPEGKYKVTKKLSTSKYYRALLLNYPNDEDIKEFRQAKKEGHIPSQAGIGGLIEIHGGGNDSITNGCISVEDEVVDKIFRLVEVGTLVTIVGTRNGENDILKALRNM